MTTRSCCCYSSYEVIMLLVECSCHNGAMCDRVTGCCDCPPGTHGNHLVLDNCSQLHLLNIGALCQFACPSNRFGWQCSQTCECLNGAVCESSTGRCLCKPGFVGEFIRCRRTQYNTRHAGDQCEKRCPNGTYGASCLLKCDCGQYSCDAVTGACKCPLGRHGPKCSTGV